jgi:hypothetical protein
MKLNPLCNDSVEVIINAFLPDSTDSTKNVLCSLKLKDIFLVVDSTKAVNPISRICSDSSDKSRVSLGLVVDQSGSMSSAIGYGDPVSKLDRTKAALINFVQGLKKEDEAFLMSFSDYVFDLQDYTNDVGKLQNTINNIFPTSCTQFLGASLAGLNKLSSRNKGTKALIILTDGLNNVYPYWGEPFVHYYVDALKGTKVYVISLSIGNSQYELQAKEQMRLMTQLGNGAYFDIYDADKLDSVYKALRNDITLDNYAQLKFLIKVDTLFKRRNLTLIANYGNSSFLQFDYFIDIFNDWCIYKRCNSCIRIRYGVAKDEVDFNYIKLALLQIDKENYRIINQKSPYPLMDLISQKTYGSVTEAENAIKEFKVLLELYFPDLANRLVSEVIKEYEVQAKW